MSNYLAIDHGTKKIGLAYKIDNNPIIPTDVIDSSSENESLRQIVKFIENKKIDEVIVGMPYNLKGEEGHQAKIVNLFIDQLKNKTDKPVHIIDERFTSALFDDRLENIDSYSASEILKSFISRKK